MGFWYQHFISTLKLIMCPLLGMLSYVSVQSQRVGTDNQQMVRWCIIQSGCMSDKMHIAAPVVWCVIPIGVCTNEKTCKGLVQLVNAYHILLQFKLLVSYAYLPKINKEIFQENLLEFLCVLTHFWRTTLFCCITWKVQSCLSFLLCFSSHDGFVSKCKCLVWFPCPFPIFLRGAHGDWHAIVLVLKTTFSYFTHILYMRGQKWKYMLSVLIFPLVHWYDCLPRHYNILLSLF